MIGEVAARLSTAVCVSVSGGCEEKEEQRVHVCGAVRVTYKGTHHVEG